MADAKSGVHHSSLKKLVIPESLTKGNKFLKWDDNSQSGTAVTLKVDPKGYILYWKDQNKEMDALELTIIRDIRTGRYARVPKDGKLRDSLCIGNPDQQLEDKTISVCYGADMVNIEWVNFVSNNADVAKEWTQVILGAAFNLLAINGSILSYLEKAYTKLSLVVSPDGRIPVRNIVKQITMKDDKRKVEKALEAANLPSGKNDLIDPNKFTFNDFFTFYRHCLGRTDVDKVFDEMGAKKKPYLTALQVKNFLNVQQRDPRLNEVLFPLVTQDTAQELINQFELNSGLRKKGHLSQEGFLKFLLSEENGLIPVEQFDLHQDMNQPLSHYFINSSHNTYLTGHQFTSKSSVELYRQTMLSGCRCVELDCWDGKGADEEPVITHGYTMCTEISFREVIEAIDECAFKTSEFPVILSFENHCSGKQQAKMATYCREIFGNKLVTEYLDDYPLKPNIPLPPIMNLKRRIIIKNKKKHFHKKKPSQSGMERKLSQKMSSATGALAGGLMPGSNIASYQRDTGNLSHETGMPLPMNQEDIEEEEDDDSDSDSEKEDDIGGLTEEEERRRQREKKEKGTAGQEAAAGWEMSALVNYIQPVHFHNFDAADRRSRSFEITSFVETQATALLKEFPIDFVNYNKRQLTRIYPRGTRVDSSNYMPQVFWNAGCQLVALNFQTLDLAMQLNLGIFEYNMGCGYILKPEFMRRKDRHFDPFAESTIDGIVAGTVSVKIISGQFLTDKKANIYVECDMYGLPADTVRKKFKSKVTSNTINPVFDEEPFVFKKIVLPELAVVRLGVVDEQGRLCGHRVLPVEGLRPGYRHIILRNECNQPLTMATLFVRIGVKDFIPDAFADFANALANPISYQSELEKHAEQLALLTEDFDIMNDELTALKLQDPVAAHASILESKFSVKRQSQYSTKRDNSISSISEEVGPGLTRQDSKGTSNSHQSLSKQESTTSQGSTSGGSGVQRVLSTGSTGVGGGGTLENGAVSIQLPAFKTKLNDPDMIIATPLETLKKDKLYSKAVHRRDKEVELLKKKNLKEAQAKKELYEVQEEKIMLEQLRARSLMEKGHSKAAKKAGKGGQRAEVEGENNKEMSNLLQTQDRELKELKEEQGLEYVTLCQNLFASEKEVIMRHHSGLFQQLKEIVDDNHTTLRKRLNDIHIHEVEEMKKRHDKKSAGDRKGIVRKHKDKEEVARLKREIQQKHVNLVVQEIQRMNQLLDRRKDELEKNLDVITKQFKDERDTYLKTVDGEYKVRLNKIIDEYKDVLPAIVAVDDSGMNIM